MFLISDFRSARDVQIQMFCPADGYIGLTDKRSDLYGAEHGQAHDQLQLDHSECTIAEESENCLSVPADLHVGFCTKY